MDLHNKICRNHFAWFDKEIAKDKRGQTGESQVKPLTPNDDDYPIVKHQSENLIHHPMTMNDVLYDLDIITYEEWQNKTK